MFHSFTFYWHLRGESLFRRGASYARATKAVVAEDAEKKTHPQKQQEIQGWITLRSLRLGGALGSA